MVSDVLRPILAHVRSKYSNTQHRIRNLEPQTDARNKFCGALDLNSKPAKTKRSRQIICQGFWRRLGGYAAAHVGSMRATVFRSVHVCGMLGPCKSVLRMASRMLASLGACVRHERPGMLRPGRRQQVHGLVLIYHSPMIFRRLWQLSSRHLGRGSASGPQTFSGTATANRLRLCPTGGP